MANTAIVTILGCGGSGGVPLAANFWGVCDPNNPKNRRMRASIAIQTAQDCVVIDTGPEFREQTIKHHLNHVDAVLYTHAHSDHVSGIDDLRYIRLKKRIETGQDQPRFPIYADQITMDEIKRRYDHLFKHSADGLYQPEIEDRLITANCDALTINDRLTFKPFVQGHGSGISLGYRIGDLAYSTDVSALDDTAFDIIKGVKTWIVDCGQYGFDSSIVHPNLDRVLEWQDCVQAEHIYLTHLTPRADYETLMNETPDNIAPCYDGMKITVTL